MKVCCFLETWDTGGIESFLLNIFEKIETNDISIDVIAVKKKSDLYVSRLKNCGINIYEISSNLHKLYTNHKIFRKMIKEKGYDVVHFNIYQALSMLYILDAKICGVKVRIAHSHNAGLRKSILKPVKLLVHNISKYLFCDAATEYWACSKDAGQFMFLKNIKYTVIPNGIDLNKFRFDNEKRDKIRIELNVIDRYVIGNVGRLCYQKNQEFLIKVFEKLKKTYDNITLLLIGDGEERDNLIKLSKKLKLEKDIIFYGTSDNIADMYSAMDIFVIPSKFEGLGIVGIEAQASGLPVICSNYIPDEVFITNLAKKIDIDNGVYEWAKAISLEINRRNERNNTLVELKNSGYDITDVSNKITLFWLSN